MRLYSLTDFNLLPLAMWAASLGGVFISQGQLFVSTDWGNPLNVTSLSASMTVNALLLGLIVFRILKVSREVRATQAASEQEILGATGVTPLVGTPPVGPPVIFVLIESGTALFAIQLARLVVTATAFRTAAENDAFLLIANIHQMFNVIITLAVVVPFYFIDNLDLARG